MKEKIHLVGKEFVDHIVDDKFWILEDPESWPCLEIPRLSEVARLNSAELGQEPEEFVIDLTNHPQITEVDHHNFGCIEVVTFRWNDPRDGELYFPGKYYKFDIWRGPATNYEAKRWTDQDYSG